MYERLPGGMFWSRQSKLIARDFGANQLFSERLSLYGDTTVISAKNDEKPGVQTGSAYVFRGYSQYPVVIVVIIVIIVVVIVIITDITVISY